MFVPPRLPDLEANCSLRKYDILMDPFTFIIQHSSFCLLLAARGRGGAMVLVLAVILAAVSSSRAAACSS